MDCTHWAVFCWQIWYSPVAVVRAFGLFLRCLPRLGMMVAHRAIISGLRRLKQGGLQLQGQLHCETVSKKQRGRGGRKVHLGAYIDVLLHTHCPQHLDPYSTWNFPPFKHLIRGRSGEDVGAHTCVQACGQLLGVRSLLLPWGSRDQTQVLKLGSKCPSPGVILLVPGIDFCQ